MNPIMAFGMPGMGELIVVLIIVLVLFGASRIPEIARSLGKGIKAFKHEVKDKDEDEGGGCGSKGCGCSGGGV